MDLKKLSNKKIAFVVWNYDVTTGINCGHKKWISRFIGIKLSKHNTHVITIFISYPVVGTPTVTISWNNIFQKYVSTVRKTTAAHCIMHTSKLYHITSRTLTIDIPHLTVININYWYNIWCLWTMDHNQLMVPTPKEILFSMTFPGQNYHFPGQSIQDLKVINQDMREKAYI